MIDPTLDFSSFVVGSSNRLAAEASRRAAELPGAAYNPLVIIGADGSGKTHLLHAMANEVLALRPAQLAVIATAESFSADLSDGASLLLIDDLHLIVGDPGKQQSLALACEAAIELDLQVVLTARPALEGVLVPALEHLLEGGLLVELEPLDSELTAGLVHRFSSARGLRFSTEALDELVSRRLTPLQLRSVVEGVHKDLERGTGEVTRSEVLDLLGEPVSGNRFDEFGSFLEDVTRVVAVAVESVPWRKKLGEAIRRWESQSIRTDRLERALQADFPEDADALLAEFERNASRLLQIRAEMGADAGAHVLDDPDRLAEAEELLGSWKAREAIAGAESAVSVVEAFRTVDPWFLDPDRLVLSAYELEGRIPGDRR